MPPPGELDGTYASCFAPLCENMTSSTKPRSTQRNVLLLKKDWATTTGNMYRKFGDIWTRGFWDMPANKQTNRHTNWYTDILIAILRPPTGVLERREKKENNERTWKTVNSATTKVSKLLAGRPPGKFHLQTTTKSPRVIPGKRLTK